MRVLVVDDIGHVRYSVARLLERHGFSVVMAGSGPEALDVLRRDPHVEFVITDLTMPGMDGLELFRLARTLEAAGVERPGTLRFLLMMAPQSGAAAREAEASRLQEALDLGFVDVIVKPPDGEKLVHTLRRWEGGKSARCDYAASLDRLRRDVDQLVEAQSLEALEALQPALEQQLARVLAATAHLRRQPAMADSRGE